MKKFVSTTIDGDAAAYWGAIQREAARFNKSLITVEEYDEKRAITGAQMSWLHCEVGPIAVLSDKMGVSKMMAEVILKIKCCEHLLVKKVDNREVILSKTVLNVNQTTDWFESIWDFMENLGWPVPKPDKEWRLKKGKK